MKLFIFGDTHTGRYHTPGVTESSIKVWSWVLENLTSVDLVVFLGDRCRSRDPEGTIRNIVDEGLVKISEKVPVVALCGNHDYYFKSGSLENNYGVLSKWSSIQIVRDKVEVTLGKVKCEFLSYGNVPSGTADFLFMHDEIEGITSWAKSGISRELLKGYRKVYSGHIHQRIREDNIVYVNVPYQQGFGDGEETGGVIVELETGKETWVDGFGSKFVIGLRKNLKDCIVRVENEEEKQEALQRGALWVEVVGKLEQTVVEKTEESTEIGNWGEWVDSYVESQGKSTLYREVGHMILEQVADGGR